MTTRKASRHGEASSFYKPTREAEFLNRMKPYQGTALLHARGNEEDHRRGRRPIQTSIPLQFATGMRFGEMAGLHIEDLDFGEPVIRIRRSTYRLEEVTPKSQAGHRQIDVDPDTMTMLKAYLGNRQSGRVFQTKHDTPLVVNNVNRHVLKPLCKKLGIPIGTTHAFRHGRISVLQQNNVPGDLIKKWVRHTSLKTTSKYTHFPIEYWRKVVSDLANNG